MCVKIIDLHEFIVNVDCILLIMYVRLSALIIIQHTGTTLKMILKIVTKEIVGEDKGSKTIFRDQVLLLVRCMIRLR